MSGYHGEVELGGNGIDNRAVAKHNRQNFIVDKWSVDPERLEELPCGAQ